jgi:hypothetical protein
LNVIQSGVLSWPLALNCHPLTVMLLLSSTSMAPVKFLLIVPADPLPIPAPFGLAPPPSSVTKLEFATTIPIPAFCRA